MVYSLAKRKSGQTLLSLIVSAVKTYLDLQSQHNFTYFEAPALLSTPATF